MMEREIESKVKYGPYLVYRDATIIDVRTGKKLKRHIRNGRYVVGLRMNTESKCSYYQLHRLLYKVFVDDSITRYDYIMPKDSNFLNLELENWIKCTASDFHREKGVSGRKKILSEEMQKKICELHEHGASLRKIGIEYRISACTVHKVINGTYQTKGEEKA